jgi:hypothetical protein
MPLVREIRLAANQAASSYAMRSPLPERQHRLGHRAGSPSGDRGGPVVEDEQACPWDLAGDRLAVADREEQVATAVDDKGGDLDLGQALAPAGLAVVATLTDR